MTTTILATKGNPPDLATLAIRSWMNSAFNHLAKSCPITRTDVRYIKLDVTNGNSTGGTGDGLSEGTAWLVGDGDDLRLLIASVQAANMRIEVKNAVYRASTGITITVDNLTLQGYWTSDGITDLKDRALLSGSIRGDHSSFGPWSIPSAGVWNATQSTNVLYVRAADDSLADPQVDANSVYTQKSTAADCDGVPGSWYYDSGANKVYVNPHSGHSVTTIEYVTATGTGIQSNGDGVRVHGWRSWGWGMEGVTSQNYCIEHDFNDGMAYITKCSCFFSSSHVCGAFGSGTGGGTIGMSDITSGLTLTDSSGNATNLIAFQSTGLYETVCQRHTPMAGALPTPNKIGSATGTNQSNKCHTDGATKFALFIDRDQLKYVNTDFPCEIGPVPKDAPEAHPRSGGRLACRSFVFNPVIDFSGPVFRNDSGGPNLILNSSNTCFANATLTNITVGAASAAIQTLGSGWFFNCEMDIDQSAMTALFIALYRELTNDISNPCDMPHNFWNIKLPVSNPSGTKKRWAFDTYNSGDLSGRDQFKFAQWVNSILQTDQDPGTWGVGLYQSALNQPLSGGAGSAGSLYFNIKSADSGTYEGYDSGDGNITLASARALGETPNPTHPYWNKGRVIQSIIGASTYEIEYDIDWRPRFSNSSGPREAIVSIGGTNHPGRPIGLGVLDD